MFPEDPATTMLLANFEGKKKLYGSRIFHDLSDEYYVKMKWLVYFHIAINEL